MFRKSLIIMTPFLLTLLLLISSAWSSEEDGSSSSWGVGPHHIVRKEQRRSLVVTEYGEVTAADVRSGRNGPYHLQFFTLHPNSLFLPVILHADMVCYVATGSGKMRWASEDEKEMRSLNLRRGDVFRLQSGSVFFMQSNLDQERQKLRIYAIFTTSDEDIYEPSIGAYSRISDLVLGFDSKVLQSAFQVPEDVIQEIVSVIKPPPMVHATPAKESIFLELEARLVKALMGSDMNGKKKKTRTFNIFDAEPDFQNCNGWSVNVDRKNLKSLKDSNIGVFMVNLTKGSMMGPHWNPMATEIGIVLQGKGMVRVVCANPDMDSSCGDESECRNMRFKVEEGDVFGVPRFHPMAQMAFNNDPLVFVGFSTSRRRNYPQFLAGKRSVLNTLDKGIVAISFDVNRTTVEHLLAAQNEELILECTDCAEEEERMMVEEIERERQEEEARRREEERKREEEERKRKEDEEEARRREEERKREEEERKRKEEEEEARKREEEEERRREEEEARKREEEKEREREREREEEEARKRKEEEEARKREEEEEREREEEEERRREEEEARKREEEKEREREEEEARKRKEEEEARKREEEEERRREEEEARKREEEKEEREREEEEARKREEQRKREEEEQERAQWERQKEEEERQRREEEARRQEEERQKRQQEEEEETRRQEEERRRQEEEEEAARKERERQEGGGGGASGEGEETGEEGEWMKGGGGGGGKGRRGLRSARKGLKQ